MATIRRKRKTASKKSGYYYPRKTTKRKQIRRKKSGMLSEFFSAQTATQTAKNSASAAIGGALAGLIEKFTPNQTPTNQSLIIGAAGFVTGAVLKRPFIGAGLVAVAAYKLLANSTLMADNNEWAEDIEALPPFMAEGGNFELADPYLLSADATDLASILENASYMPAYGPQFNQV